MAVELGSPVIESSGRDASTLPKTKGEKISELRRSCILKGGKWDSVKNVCIMPEQEKKKPKPNIPQVNPTKPEPIFDQDTGRLTGFTDTQGNTFFGSPHQIREDIAAHNRPREVPEGTQPFGTSQKKVEQAIEGEALAQQVGQTVPSSTTPTEGLVPGVSTREAVTVGLREAIPRALSLAGGAAVAGASAGLATGGTASIPFAVAAGAVTFIGSISSSILSNMKSQRTDDTTAQQRVLDEGKQILQDWATQAAADPSKRAEYLAQFNKQLQLIQDAHVQMLTDTNADVLKFETALPNLAEFDSFYSVGGERDALVAEMQRALRGEMNPLEINFKMLELANRRGNQELFQENKQGFLSQLIP